LSVVRGEMIRSAEAEGTAAYGGEPEERTGARQRSARRWETDSRERKTPGDGLAHNDRDGRVATRGGVRAIERRNRN